MNNFYISFPGRLCNQLMLLHHIYNICNKVDHIYAPFFEEYLFYFNAKDRGIFCDGEFFEANKESFVEVKWEDQDIYSISDMYDSRFDDLKLKPIFEKDVTYMTKLMGDKDLVAVHIRQGDYKDFRGGRYFFTPERYIEVTQKKIKEWGLDKYKILLFSDIVLPNHGDGFIVSSLTNNAPPIDLFLMARCNYFIHTWSTFPLLAMVFSKGLRKFVDHQLVE